MRAGIRRSRARSWHAVTPWKTTRKGIAEIHIAKHRNGEIGMFNLTFQGMYSRFANFVPDSYAEGIMR